MFGSSINPYALNVSDDFYYLVKDRRKQSSVGLVSQSYTYYFKNRHRYPKVKYHRKRFTCHTKIKGWKTFDAYVDILVRGKRFHKYQLKSTQSMLTQKAYFSHKKTDLVKCHQKFFPVFQLRRKIPHVRHP